VYDIIRALFELRAASVMQKRTDDTVGRGDPPTGSPAAGLGASEAVSPALPSISSGLPSPSAVDEHDGEPTVVAFRRLSAENSKGPASDSRSEAASLAKAGRFHYFTTPFGFALFLSLTWVAAVIFTNVFLSSLALQLLSAAGPIAIFCAMQYWRTANETTKNRIRALEQERADATKADKLAQLAAKARADLATIDEAVDKTTERSLALSNTVTAEAQKLEGVCRESEGLLAGLIQSAVEAQLRAVSSHKQLQEAAAAEAKRLQALTNEVLASFETSGKHVIGEVTTTLDSARNAVEALFDRKTADGQRAFDARVKQLTESFSARESEYQSRLDAANRKADQRYETAIRAALESFDRSAEAFSTQLARQNTTVGGLIERRAAEIQGSLGAHAMTLETNARTALESFNRAVETFSTQLGRQNATALALVEKRTADIQGSLGAHSTAMDGVASTVKRDIESSQKSILAALSGVAPSLSDAGAKLLDVISGAIVKNMAQTDSAVALVEKRAADIQGSLGAHTAAMDGVASTVRREIEGSQKSILAAFSEVAPSLSGTGAKLLDTISGSIAENKAQTDEAMRELVTALDDFQKERESQIETAVQEISRQMASSYGQIAVLFDVHGDDFANRLDARIEELKAELEERKRVIEDFLSTARGSLSEEALRRLEAFDQNMQNQAITLHSAMSVRLAEIDAAVTRIGDHVLYELGAAITKLKGELPYQAEAFVREISDAGAMVSVKADEMARTLEQSSSVFLEALESRTQQLDKTIVDDGSALVARVEQTSQRLSEVMSETREALDADFRRNSSDAIASITSQNEQIEALFNKAVQSAIDQMASHIDFLMETLRSSATRLDQLIRVDGGQLAAGLQDYAERTATDLKAAIDRIDGVNQGQADDWTARVNESANALVREIDAKLDNFDGHVDQKLHEVFEQAARLIVRLQNGLDMKAGILNEMLGRRASELSKIIGTMIDGYVNTEGPSK
jgi:hypothetical protein